MKSTLDIDLSVFKLPNDEIFNNRMCGIMCEEDHNFNDMCLQLQRMILAHDYYKLLDIENNKNHKEIFCQFINDVYAENILNDYEHLIVAHRQNIYQINKILTNRSSTICQFKDCKMSARHFTRRDVNGDHEEKTEETPDDSDKVDHKMAFYCSLFDGAHFYIWHFFECGLRILPNHANKDDHTDIANPDSIEDEKNIFYDKELNRVSQEIKRKREIMKSFDRFQQTNTKCNIAINSQNDGILSEYVSLFTVLLYRWFRL